MPAVKAFDSEVMSVLSPRLLAAGGAEILVDEVVAMHKAWNTQAVTAVERNVIREIFYDRGYAGDFGEHTMRARTLEVFRRALAQAGEPCATDDVRRILASWRYQDGRRFEPGADVQDRALDAMRYLALGPCPLSGHRQNFMNVRDARLADLSTL